MSSISLDFLQFHDLGVGAEAALIPIAVFSLEGLLVKPAVMGKAGHINGAAMHRTPLLELDVGACRHARRRTVNDGP